MATKQDRAGDLQAALRTVQLGAARWQGFLDNARDAIVSIDAAGNVTLFNPAAETIFGYAADEVVGRSVRLLMPAPYADEHGDYLRRYRETGVPHAIGRIRDVEAKRKDGTTFPIELSVSETRLGDEVIYLAIIRDVSERHQILGSLRARAQQMEAAAELGLGLAGDLDALLNRAVGLIARVLDAELCKVLELMPDGRSFLLRAGVGWREELIGHALVPNDRTSQAGYTHLSEGPVLVEDFARETRFAPPPLLREHDAVSGISVPIPGRGRPFGILGAHSKQVRRFSADDAHFLVTMAHLLSEAIEHRQEERRTRAQREATQVLSSARSLGEGAAQLVEVVGRAVGSESCEFWLVDLETERLRREALWRSECASPGLVEALTEEWSFQVGQGFPGHVWAAGRPLGSPDLLADPTIGPAVQRARERAGVRGAFGFPIRGRDEILGVITCLSAGPRVPDPELVSVLASLGSQIGDFVRRMCALERLERAEEQARQNARLADVGALTTRIVHDLGNPLAGISMLAQRMKRLIDRDDSAPVAKLRGSAEQILATTKRLDALIHDFKNFVRDQRLELRTIELPGLLEELLAAWEPEATERSIELLSAVPAEIPPIRADPEKLRRVLDNLVKNALEAIERGPGRVNLSLARCGSSIRICVEDTGPGFPEQIQPFRLFETSKPNGTGLGLAIVKEIITAHGGGIELASTPGKGTQFRIELPIHEQRSAPHMH